MGAWKKVLAHVAWSVLFVSGWGGAVLPTAAQQAAMPQSRQTGAQTQPDTPGEPQLAELPDSPGATLAQSQAPPSPQTAQPQSSPNQNQANQNQQSPSAPQKPVGTAAAEAPPTSGVAASQPAGVAIAPAKQRRIRTIVLRTGAIIGAGVAIGSVVALTAATSSRPPGAH